MREYRKRISEKAGNLDCRNSGYSVEVSIISLIKNCHFAHGTGLLIVPEYMANYPFNGNANDLSIKANHGNIRGATQVADRFGISNAAYHFDGVDDFIEIKAEPLQLNNFTYSIWVQPHVLPAYGQALFFFSVGSDYGDQHILFGDHYSNDRHTGLSHGSYLGVANNILCTEPSVPPIDV